MVTGPADAEGWRRFTDRDSDNSTACLAFLANEPSGECEQLNAKIDWDDIGAAVQTFNEIQVGQELFVYYGEQYARGHYPQSVQDHLFNQYGCILREQRILEMQIGKRQAAHLVQYAPSMRGREEFVRQHTKPAHPDGEEASEGMAILAEEIQAVATKLLRAKLKDGSLLK